MKNFVKAALLVFPLCLFSGVSHAVIIFDWSNANIDAGGTSGSVVADGITLDFEIARVGTATGNASNITAGRLLYFSQNDYNGSTPATDTLVNYSTLTLTFSQSVNLVGNQFSLIDVDHYENNNPNSWQDFISVDASDSISGVSTVSYTPASATNQSVESNYYGREGVVGINEFNASPAGTDLRSNVIVGVDKSVDTLTIYFAQGVLGTDASSHGILIDNIAVVPEPSTVGLLFGMCAFVFVCTLRRRKAG